MLELGYKINITTKLKDFLVEKGYDEKYGERPLNGDTKIYRRPNRKDVRV